MFKHLKKSVSSYIYDPTCRINASTGQLEGSSLVQAERRLGDLPNLFEDDTARKAMDPDLLVYHVVAHMTVPEGTPGGLFFGTSYVEAGRVGDEYFMTKGHLHSKKNTGEYYWGIRGEGALILMDEQRNCRAERVFPGSLHYIPGKTAHRLANTGDETLAVGACWMSESGHDYSSIEQFGFSARLKSVDCVPFLFKGE